MMSHNNKPVANPLVVLREEFDDWAVLFDPDTGNAFVWKLLDGSHAEEDVLRKLRESYEDVPEEVEDHIRDFIQTLVERGVAGYEVKKE